MIRRFISPCSQLLCLALTVFTASIVAVPSTADATIPVVDRLEPLGVVRGEESTIIFHGTRVGDAHQVLTDIPGIEILSVKVLDSKRVEVKLKTDPNLNPGLYPVRLIAKSGIANLRLLGVGSTPIVQEVEPNNEFAVPQTVEMNRTIEGVVDREDIDHYQVKLAKGEKLTVEVEGIRIAYSLRNQNILDPYVAILDEGRFEVATSDDSPLLQQDGLCSYTAPVDGVYTVVVRDSAFGGNRICGYRLHIGSYPRPVAIIPAGGVTGATMNAKLIDIDGTISESKIQLPSSPSDAYGIVTETDKGLSPSPNWIRVNDLPVVMETEPNDDYRKAPDFTVPAAFCGVIEKPGDYDCFGFECKKGQKFRVQVYSRKVLRSPLDAYMNVFGPDNKTISSSDDASGNVDPFIEFTAKADGKHTIRLYDQLRGGSPIHNYRIEVSPATPEFGVVLKELRRDEAHVVSIPAGGQIGMVLQTQRRGYNGEINFELAGLPAGVTAKTFPMPSGRNEIPVMLSAAADAELGGTLFDIAGSGDAKNPLVFGQLKQTHKLVLGQNRRHMWAYDTDRAAAAVTDKAPFTIEMIQPKTPIVRSGSKELLVRIKRDEGFEGTVTLRTLYNPPGIGINNSRNIPKGKDEARIPITANSSAAIGTWPVVMTASYSSKTGTAYIATNEIMLDVETSLFKYEFPRAAAEIGSEAVIAVTLEQLREYEGDAEVQIVGLPNGVTSSAAIQKITKDATSVTFPITIDAKAKAGKFKTLNVQSRVKVGDETIVQTTGTGELRVDKPLPPKKDAPPAKKAEPKPKAKPAAAKPLSRLEQLRLQKK